MRAEAVPAVPGDACPLCGTGTAPADHRCGSCGFDLAGVGERPGPFTRAVFWWTAMGFLAVYLGTLAIVALTR